MLGVPLTEILSSNPVNPDKAAISRAAEIIINGGIVAFPTETVYGIGADAFNPDACRKIFEAKGRPRDNPLIVHISSLRQLEGVAVDIPERIMGALGTLWPGPVTFILKKNGRVPDEVSAGLDTVAVRIPAHPIALRLIEASGTAIAAPSANLAGKPSPTNAAHVLSDLDGKIDAIIDGGDCAFGLESTIINATESPAVLLRPGAFTIEELSGIIGSITVSGNVNESLRSGTAIAPGMKYRHYAPRTRLIVVKDEDTLIRLSRSNAGKVAIMCSDELAEKMDSGKAIVVRLGSGRDLYRIAKNLFGSLRELDKAGADIAFIQTFPERGIGLAIMNRILKASGGAGKNSEELAEFL